MKGLIRKILKEESLKQNLKQEIKENGFKDTAELVGDVDILLEILNISDPMEFLNLFNDLDVVQSKEQPDWTLFRYKKHHNLMVYDRKNNYVYINYGDIWSVLRDHFGLKRIEIQRLTEEWLDEVYNLRGITTPVVGGHSEAVVG